MLTFRASLRQNVGLHDSYEYGIAAGRAAAFGKLSENSDSETQKFAERLRIQIHGKALPPSIVIAALLEIAWVFAHDIQINRTNDDA